MTFISYVPFKTPNRSVCLTNSTKILNKAFMPNRLAQTSSPYLLQHANNPVDWYPWSEEALQRARQEEKPIIVSIGYSACHWCHVMERESFENEQIADLMNRYFVCIKVDREERPDVDAIYMDAVQGMGVHGGWPLNVFLLPDQRPFFGGTYFKPAQWADLLDRIGRSFAHPEYRPQLEESADRLTNFLNVSESERYELETSQATPFAEAQLRKALDRLKEQFDTHHGGVGQAPKFPMPSVYMLLLRSYHLTRDETLLRQAELTLQKMARGGIYDQIGGGFARYSVTKDWLVPHFEKMLYDNAQLLSLYAEAYRLTQHAEYRQVLEQTITFLERELSNGEGGFFSALDADSEGEEGKFYLWTPAEVREILPEEEADLCRRYYDIREGGNWPEAGKSILQRQQSDEAFAQKHELDPAVLRQKVKRWQQLLLEAREQRIRPERDEKTLTSWNGLTMKGLVDAHLALDDEAPLQLAKGIAEFLENRLYQGDQLWHNYKDGKAGILGYLEDYAAVIQGLLALYQATFEERWLHRAERLTAYVLANFRDEDEALLFFTDKQGEALVARKKEVFDNVIPASNSMMANNLLTLSHLMARDDYREQALALWAQIQGHFPREPRFLSNWGVFYTQLARAIAEVAFVGAEAAAFRRQFVAHYDPHQVVLGTRTGSELALLRDKEPQPDQTHIYVCQNRTCRLPVTSVKEAQAELKRLRKAE